MFLLRLHSSAIKIGKSRLQEAGRVMNNALTSDMEDLNACKNHSYFIISIGSIVGMFLFHHKIRMAKFRFGLPLILVLQIGFIVLLRSVMVSIVFL